MANEIKVGKNESIDSALRRFKRMSQKAGTLAEVRKREHYEKPSVRRKKKSEAARKRKYRGYSVICARRLRVERFAGAFLYEERKVNHVYQGTAHS